MSLSLDVDVERERTLRFQRPKDLTRKLNHLRKVVRYFLNGGVLGGYNFRHIINEIRKLSGWKENDEKKENNE